MGYTKQLSNKKTDERGLSLLEVAAALYIVALIVMGVLLTSTTSALWISGARDQTVMSVYAASIIDVLDSNSLQLHEQLQTANPWIITDENITDAVFIFTLYDEVISLEAPEDIHTTITASRFDDSVYYDGISSEGIYEIGIGDNAEPILFYGNLMEVNVEMQWADGSCNYKLSAIVGAR